MTRMRSLAVALAVLVSLAAGLAAMAASPPGSGRSSGPRLVFNATFNGSQLNHARWSTCYWWGSRGCTIATNRELEWYLPGQVSVGGGMVRLIASRRWVRGADGALYRYASGMISSGPTPTADRPKFAFRYGLAEARMWIPAGAGLWPAFWLLPANESDLPEIDVAEIIGQSPGVVRMHLHYRGRRGKNAVDGFDWHSGASLAAGWHLFGIDWEPGRITWLVDGHTRWSVTGSAVPHVPMYPIADLAVGGQQAGKPSAQTRFPSALAINWIRVWQ